MSASTVDPFQDDDGKLNDNALKYELRRNLRHMTKEAAIKGRITSAPHACNI